jgi:hypothetical protein
VPKHIFDLVKFDLVTISPIIQEYFLINEESVEQNPPKARQLLKINNADTDETGGHLIEFHLIESVDRIFRSNA